MPREKINTPTQTLGKQLEVAWNRIGWVQINIHEPEWRDSSEWFIADLTPEAIDKLIKTLRKAKKQAYGEGFRHYGFSDGGPVTVNVDGRDFTVTTEPGGFVTSDQILTASGLAPASDYDLCRVIDHQVERQTKANAFVLDGSEDFITARISTN